MIPSVLSLPAEIAAIVGRAYTIERPFQGMAFDTSVLHSDRGRFVLKWSADTRLSAQLVAEQRVLRALSAYQPHVAEPLAFTLWEDAGWSLLSYLEGSNLVEALAAEDVAGRHAIVAQYGWALRRVHCWTPDLPRPAHWLDAALDRAERIVRRQGAGTIEHLDRCGSVNPEQVLTELRQWAPTVTLDLVFSHRDFCMPNVLLHEGRLSGVVDWSLGGYADRRYDLATGAWSIVRNLGHHRYVPTFLQAYGYAGTEESLRPFEALYHLSD